MQVDIRKNYLIKIEASVGSALFKNLYITQRDQSVDVAKDGELSCAIHVSSILALSGLIDGPHATVGTTLKEMNEAGWQLSDNPAVGAVMYWPAGDDGHEHIGFWLSRGKVISNSAIKRVPVIHNETMLDGRTPTRYYIHPELK